MGAVICISSPFPDNPNYFLIRLSFFVIKVLKSTVLRGFIGERDAAAPPDDAIHTYLPRSGARHTCYGVAAVRMTASTSDRII